MGHNSIRELCQDTQLIGNAVWIYLQGIWLQRPHPLLWYNFREVSLNLTISVSFISFYRTFVEIKFNNIFNAFLLLNKVYYLTLLLRKNACDCSWLIGLLTHWSQMEISPGAHSFPSLSRDFSIALPQRGLIMSFSRRHGFNATPLLWFLLLPAQWSTILGGEEDICESQCSSKYASFISGPWVYVQSKAFYFTFILL